MLSRCQHTGSCHRRSFAVRMGCCYMLVLGSSHPGIPVVGMGYSCMIAAGLPLCLIVVGKGH